jgi:tRNA A-37 threonylcarbamoyl transferase component Bud32
MTPPGAALADALLADRYRLLERIAVGGMGEVWRAQDCVLDRVVAVKTLKPEHLADDDFRARFRAEARHAGGLSHPGIASVYDYGESGGRAFLVMELVDGEPLSSLLRSEGTLSPDRTLDLVAQVAAALQAAHAGGVVHRDVKPGNLLVRPDGVLKVTDFGISSAVDAVPLTQTGTLVGTAYYLSPEQAAGSSATPASDVYALGVVAYECLVGQRPFPGDNPVTVAMAHLRTPPPELPPSVPAPVRALVLRCLAKDPAERFADAGALSRAAAELRARLAAEPAVAHEPDGGLAALAVDPPRGARAPGAAEPTQGLAAQTARIALPSERAGVRRPPRSTPGSVPGSRAGSSRRAVRAVVALLAVVAVVFGVRAGAAPSMVVVPTIAAGTPEASATGVLTAADLTVQRRTETSPTIAAGRVLSQSPEGGAEVEPGSAVLLVVSEGPPPVEVDPAAYVGSPAQEVQAALIGLGLVPRLAYDGSGSPVGTVSAVEPTGTLAPGQSVLLHVVPTPPPAPVVQAPAPAPAPESAPGSKGKAKGKGNGKGKGGT